MEFAKDERTRQLLRLLIVTQDLDRPLLLPPGVPPERVRELRDAFNATVADPVTVMPMSAAWRAREGLNVFI